MAASHAGSGRTVTLKIERGLRSGRTRKAFPAAVQGLLDRCGLTGMNSVHFNETRSPCDYVNIGQQ